MSANTLGLLKRVRDAALVGPLTADQVELLRAVHGHHYEPLLAGRLSTAALSSRADVVRSLVMRGAPSGGLGEASRPRVLLAELRERLAMSWVAEDAILIVQRAEAHRARDDRDARRAARS